MRSAFVRLAWAGAVAALVALPGGASAQRRPPEPGRPGAFRSGLRVAQPEVGVRGGADFSTGGGSVGLDARLPGDRFGRLLLVPSGDLYFTEGGHDWQTNVDAEVRPVPLAGLYGGGGLAVIHHTFQPILGRQTKVGWNLFAGLEPVTPLPVRPYVEARWTFHGEDYSAFRLVAGLHLAFRGRRGRVPRAPRPRWRPPRRR